MVALLILMAVMAIAMTVALPAWNTMSRREKEAELRFRGEQYARAITLFQRKYAGAFPPTVDVLVTERFLRKKFKDPITNGDFQLIAVGQAVAGAQSANPLTAGRGGAAGQAPAGGPRGAGGGAGAGASAGSTTTGRAGSASTPAGGGRSTFTLNTTAGRAAQAGTIGAGGATPGFMGVTSKSKDPSLRNYKGGDHYDQWLFIATQASNQAGGRGGQTPGEGVRGGAPPGGRPAGPGGRPGGPGGAGGRQGQPPTSSPFGGTNPFNPGQGPVPAGPPGRGR